MDKTKLHDLFKLAMWDEHISAALYASIAERTSDKLARQKLLYLAADEKGHFDTLREMHAAFCCPVEISVTEITMPLQAQAFIGGKSSIDLEAFLTYAMEKERSAQDFYVGMCGTMDDDKDSCATLLHFSAMEADHFNLLKTELENIRRHKGTKL